MFEFQKKTRQEQKKRAKVLKKGQKSQKKNGEKFLKTRANFGKF